MLDLADRSKSASVDELIAIADRVSEIEMILGNVSFDEDTAILKPITKLNPI